MAAQSTAPPRPALESGDHLTRDEFHRRYCQRPDIVRAELIGGIAYVSSPVRTPQHGEPHSILVGWAVAYRLLHPGVRTSDNGTFRPRDVDAEVQPDISLWLEREGLTRLDGDGYLELAPDLIVEVAASSASYDLHEKKDLYERIGVPEYLVWLVDDDQILWYRHQGGRYLPAEASDTGMIESLVLPGLRLNVRKLLAGDTSSILPDLAARAGQETA
ncbi:MAG: Uma2 family endonuclease [Tepidiformaceae bacterium]